MSKSTEKTVAGQATKPGAAAAKPAYSFDFKITSDEQHAAAIEQMIAWEQAPDAADNKALALLADAVEAYETTEGHTPEPPVTLRGYRINQSSGLDIARLASRLSIKL
ncbi:hypothetical protein ACFQ48_19820, partial [Hymenobacter caeli]